MDLLTHFLKAFVPIFVAIDAPGLLPLYLGLTEGVDRPQRRRVLAQSIITAFLVAIGFILLGNVLFGLIGVTVSDFAIAGGILLFIIAVGDVITGHKVARQAEMHGAVPLGTPLIAGPATLTTALMLVQTYGLPMTITSVVANLVIAWMILRGAEPVERVLGKAGSRAMSKVAGLILAAYAVMMIRSGVVATVVAFRAGHP